LSRAFPKGDALLHGSRHGAGEIWFVVAQRIIPGGYRSLNARFQISEPTQHTDDAVTELLEDRGNVVIAGRGGVDKAGLEASCGAIEVDALHEDAMEMEIHIERTAKTLDKRDRPWLDCGPWDTTCDRLVHIILTDCRADDRMDLRRQILGRGHPVPQRDRHRDDPLAGRDPGRDARDEGGGPRGPPPGRPRRAKAGPLAAVGQRPASSE